VARVSGACRKRARRARPGQEDTRGRGVRPVLRADDGREGREAGQEPGRRRRRRPLPARPVAPGLLPALCAPARHGAPRPPDLPHQPAAERDRRAVRQARRSLSRSRNGPHPHCRRRHMRRPEEREAQRTLAERVTLLVHGREGLDAAQRATQVLFHDDVGQLLQMTPEQLQLSFSAIPSVDMVFRYAQLCQQTFSGLMPKNVIGPCICISTSKNMKYFLLKYALHQTLET